MPDCPDLDRAANAAAGAIFYNMGEMCTAGSRLLVHRDIKEVFLDKLIAAARSYTPGNPLDPQTSMGAIVDNVQLERVLGYIEAGRAEAKLLLGGRVSSRKPAASISNRPSSRSRLPVRRSP
jgi:NAD-dependent aldehyde dehydrogenases